jgi:ribosome-associated protein
MSSVGKVNRSGLGQAAASQQRSQLAIATKATAHSAHAEHHGVQAVIGSDPESQLRLVETVLDDDQADEPVVINLTGKSSIADYMVVASGRSARHVASMTEHLQARLKAAGAVRVTVEGMATCDWVLIDTGDIIVHLFRPEVRDFYNLEKMWGMAPPQKVPAGHA